MMIDVPDTETAEKLARGLGWASIGLGLTELVAARTLTRALGMEGHETLVRAYGAREVATGLGILLSRDATPWIWGRVAGDGLDLATLAPAASPDSPKQANGIAAALFVAAVTAVDVLCVAGLSQRQLRRSESARRDYSDRSGFPRPPAAMRGVAKDAAIPRDMRAPEAMRPYTYTPPSGADGAAAEWTGTKTAAPVSPSAE